MSIETAVKNEWENFKWRNKLVSRKADPKHRVWFEFKMGSHSFILGGHRWYEFGLEYNPYYQFLDGTRWIEFPIFRTPWGK